MPRFEVIWPKGVGYRTSPNLDAKAEDRVPAKRGDVVIGEVSEGWVLTEEGLYLPLQAPDGRALLKKLTNFIPWQGPSDDDDAAGAFGADPLGGPYAGLPPALPGRAGGSVGSGGGVGGGGSGLSELDALHQKYDKKYGKPKCGSTAAEMFGSAATSHERHTAYMHEFRGALEEMGMDTRDDPYLNAYAPTPGSAHAVAAVRRSSGPSRDSSGSRPGSRVSSRAGGTAGARSPGSTNTTMRPSSRALAGRGEAGNSSAAGGHLALCGAMVVTRSAASGASGKWRDGPANSIVPVKQWTSVKHGREVTNTCSSGRVIDVSDRNVMCMSVLGEKAVMGSADHGLKEVNVRAGQVLRTLYTKRCGHTEWVTTVSHCPDGRVLSGGMDSKLCLWNASGAVCVDLTGHLGSISRVRTHAARNYAISSAYDRTLRVWDLRSKTEMACCTGHDAPILDFIWADDVIASGDRGGTVRLWDAMRAQFVAALKGHKGHITSMLALPESCTGGGGGTDAALTDAADVIVGGATSTPSSGGGAGTSLIATGAQDGHIRVWDLRARINAFNMLAHPGGAINEMGVTLGDSPPLLCSVGADGRMLVLEPRASFRPLWEFTGITPDFIYSMLVLDDLAFTGDGHGKVTCFDVRGGTQQYTLEAGTNAIRCMGATASNLICAGDDGNAIIFDF